MGKVRKSIMEELEHAAFPNGYDGPVAHYVEALKAAIDERDAIIEDQLCASCDHSAIKERDEALATVSHLRSVCKTLSDRVPGGHCVNCGKPTTETEYVVNFGLCEACFGNPPSPKDGQLNDD